MSFDSTLYFLGTHSVFIYSDTTSVFGVIDSAQDLFLQIQDWALCCLVGEYLPFFLEPSSSDASKTQLSKESILIAHTSSNGWKHQLGLLRTSVLLSTTVRSQRAFHVDRIPTAHWWHWPSRGRREWGRFGHSNHVPPVAWASPRCAHSTCVSEPVNSLCSLRYGPQLPMLPPQTT